MIGLSKRHLFNTALSTDMSHNNNNKIHKFYNVLVKNIWHLLDSMDLIKPENTMEN